MPQETSSDAVYRRDEELRRRINSFLCETFHLPADNYFGEMDLSSLLELKSVLSDINNTLTMRLTLGFADWIAQALKMDRAALARLRNDVLSTKPSTNGYDVSFDHSPPIVAEVKCNVPINGGTKYGAAQKNGIIADIEALLNGKSKASSAPAPAQSLKFMVFLDLPAVRAANAHLIASNSRISKEFVILKTEQVPNDPKVVYGVYANLGA
jgi:hypothetical protein